MLSLYSFSLPNEVKIIEGKEQAIEIKVPLTFYLSGPDNFLTINGSSIKDKLSVNLRKPLVLQSSKLGTYDLQFKLLGFIPVKNMKVHVLPEVKVVPGGHSVGVKLRPDGIIIVGIASVTDKDGKRQYPAQEAGLEVGDTILTINEQKIYKAEDVSTIINKCNDKKNINLSVKRNGKILTKQINAIESKSGNYQIGLWVRDITAGVGTLTFYEPKSGYYGALGHIITDTDTGKPIEVGEGEIIRAKVASIFPGRKNQPGEKRGVFINENKIMGNILANTPLGIYGKVTRPIKNPYYPYLPLASISQVHEGKAKILTVVENEKIEEYDIEIIKIFKQSYPNGKGMIIKVTDDDLIKKTGGIIQGMSGSPIIQDGYMVGAVTHVFVNDPTKGYGVFAEWMIDEIYKLSSYVNSAS